MDTHQHLVSLRSLSVLLSKSYPEAKVTLAPTPILCLLISYHFIQYRLCSHTYYTIYSDPHYVLLKLNEVKSCIHV